MTNENAIRILTAALAEEREILSWTEGRNSVGKEPSPHIRRSRERHIRNMRDRVSAFELAISALGGSIDGIGKAGAHEGDGRAEGVSGGDQRNSPHS